MDLISRQAAIDEMKARRDSAKEWYDNADEDSIRIRADSAMASFIECILTLQKLPSAQPERRWETCFDCPLSHGCPKIKGCTNEQAEQYASEIPKGCPLSAQPEIIYCKGCRDARDCDIQYHAQAGDLFYCGAAERRTDA